MAEKSITLEQRLENLKTIQEQGLINISDNAVDSILSFYDTKIERNSLTEDEKERLVDNIEEFVDIYGGLMHDTRKQNRFIFSTVRRILNEEQSERDGLTGVYNRKKFDSDLGTFVEQVDRLHKEGTQFDVSLMMFDIDDFKSVNDTYGHQMGDWVLKTYSAIINESMRGHERKFLYRYGGEEFAIMIGGSTIEDAMGLADRIKNKISEEMPKQIEELAKGSNSLSYQAKMMIKHNRSITASIGISNYKGTCNDAEDLVQKADQALYLAKKNGKNRYEVIFHDGSVAGNRPYQMSLPGMKRYAKAV